jgi:uncharacterized membrane protein YjfL (UPF0719 family)
MTQKLVSFDADVPVFVAVVVVVVFVALAPHKDVQSIRFVDPGNSALDVAWHSDFFLVCDNSST